MPGRPSGIDGFVMAELARRVTDPIEYCVLGEWGRGGLRRLAGYLGLSFGPDIGADTAAWRAGSSALPEYRMVGW